MSVKHWLDRMDSKFIRNNLMNLANSKIVMQLVSFIKLDIWSNISLKNSIWILIKWIPQMQKLDVLISELLYLIPIQTLALNKPEFAWIIVHRVKQTWAICEFMALCIKSHQSNLSCFKLLDLNFFFKPCNLSNLTHNDFDGIIIQWI